MRVRHYVSGLLTAVALAFSVGVAAKTTLKFSIGAPESGGGEILGMKALKEYVEFKSAGEIEIRLFFNTFGGSLQVTEQVKNGTLEMALTDDSVLGSFHKPMQVFQIPYLFASSPVAWEFMKSPFVRELNDDMRKATGIRTLAYLVAWQLRLQARLCSSLMLRQLNVPWAQLPHKPADSPPRLARWPNRFTQGKLH